MAYKSGWCGAAASGSQAHVRCAGISPNGVRASERYTLCSCQCHDGNETTYANVLGLLKDWPVAEPLNASAAELSRYVDTVNALFRPSATN